MAVIKELKIESKLNPICVIEKKPIFSWKFENYHTGFSQSAYRIIVSTKAEFLEENRADLWDSGKVLSDDCNGIEYRGRELKSREECFIKVKIWDEAGVESDWSEAAWFKMGLLQKKDWDAKWIGYDKEVIKPFDPNKPYFVADDFDKGTNELHLPPPPYFKKVFTAVKPVKKAYIYVAALGLYELSINGNKVGSEYFTPGWSDYNKRVYYDAYEIAVAEGKNTLGIILADGWYAGYVGLKSRHVWGEKPRVIARLDIEYTDGSHDAVCTDESWQAAYGPIREADLLHGEKYDARIEIMEWESPVVEDSVRIPLVAHVGSYNRIVEEIEPVLLSKRENGALLYDAGKNITGFVSLKNINEAEGTEIVFDYAEILNSDGDIDKKVYRSARAMDFYISNGKANQSFAPRFTFRSFRYFKISGLSRIPEPEDVKGLFVSSDMNSTGEFECSDKVLNSIFKMLKHTIKCGYMEVPMDCCERDERLGWGQDGNHSLQFGSFVYDISNFLKKWQNDILDSQKEDGSFGPTAPFVDMGDIGQFRGDIMADCGLHTPWILYNMYGDKRILERCYPALKKYFKFMQDNSDRNMRNSISGDWLQILDNGFTDYVHGWGATARDLIGTAFYAYGAEIMKEIAEVLGLDEDARVYEEQYLKIKKAFMNTFELRGNQFRDNTQTGYSLALYFDLISKNMRKYVAKYLYEDVKRRNYSLTGGIAGIAYVLNALSDNGYHEAAVETMANEEYPGFGYMLRMGATTCWERWDSLHHEAGVHPHNMNSYNHIGLTSGGTWFFKKLAGIQSTKPGFKELKIEPFTEGKLNYVKVNLETVYGPVCVNWRKSERQIEYEFTVPPNVKAQICLSYTCSYSASEHITLDGTKDGKMTFIAACGTHSIIVKTEKN